MNIAIFHNLPSGGALRALSEKIRLFKNRGHRVELFIFSTAERELFAAEKAADKTVVEPLEFTGFFKFKKYFKASRCLAEKINASGADRVWIEKCQFFGAPPILSFLKGSPIFYIQEPIRIRAYEALAPEIGEGERFAGSKLKLRDWPEKFFKIPAHFFIKSRDRKNTRKAGRVYANSLYSAEWIRQVYGIEAQPLYQGVDEDFFKPVSGVVAKNQVLSIGRIDESKAHDFVIRVLGKISEKIRPTLVIVCDAVEARVLCALEAQAASAGVRLEIRPRVSEEALRMFYNESLAVLCGAHHEPFGLVPLEAGACGAPVLAVDEGGFRETVVDGRTGRLLPRDEDLWGRALQELLFDESLRKRMGEAARAEMISRWRWDLLMPQYEKVLVQ